MALVRKSIQDVQKLAAQTKECADWTKNNLFQFSAQVSTLKGQAAAKHAEVEAFQRDALGKALAA
jgi:hypothetical protein